jgi:hypothetical protein
VKASVLSGGIGRSISFAVVILLVGCQQNESLYGTWQGDRDWKTINTTNEAAARALAAVDLVIKADGTFLLTDGGMPFGGKWRRSGDSIELIVETFMNADILKQTKDVQDAASFEVELQGDKLRYRPKDAKDWLELTKKPKP